MNILLCTTRMGIGGAETHVFTLALALRRKGHSVCVASSGGVYSNELEKNGVRHVVLPLEKRDPASLIVSYKGLLKVASEMRADIVHAHGRIPSFVCGLLRHRPDFPPFVTTAHGLYSYAAPKGILTVWGEKTISVSESVTDWLKKVYRLKDERITEIPNGIIVPEIKKEAHAFPSLLMCSRLDFDSSGPVSDVIDAFPSVLESFPDASLTVLGDGDRFEFIQKHVCELNLQEHIKLAGAVTDVSAFYSKADLFVGCSRSAIEAIASGVPTLILSPKDRHSVCGELVTVDNIEKYGKNNFLMLDGDGSVELTSRLISAIRSAADNKPNKACTEYILENHSVETTAEKTLEVYLSVLKDKRRGIVLCGYFGAGNLGDDATLETVSGQIREFAPEAPVYATVSSKRMTGIPEDIRPINKFDLASLFFALRKSRLFVFCGGSLIQNFTSNRSLWYYSFLTRLSVKAGCKVCIWGGGLGPLCGTKALKAASKTLIPAFPVCLRDGYSAALYSELTGREAILTDDPVFDYFLSHPFTASANRTENSVIIIPRGISKIYGKKANAALINAIGNTADSLLKAGFSVGIMPLSDSDIGLCRKLASLTGSEYIKKPRSASDAVSTVSGYSRCLSVRLHGAVFSYAAGTPCVCIAYDPKVSSFARKVGFDCADVTSLNSDALTEKVKSQTPIMPVSTQTECVSIAKQKIGALYNYE